MDLSWYLPVLANNNSQAVHAPRSQAARPLAVRRPRFAARLLEHFHRLLAWYGHLKFKTSPIFLAIVVSWGIAFVEYCFAVPANRIGNAVYSPAELKSIQEVITLIVFAGFTAIYFREPLTLIQGAGFTLIALGAVLVFKSNA